MEILILILALFGLGGGSLALVVRNLYYICQPSEVIIFAGSRQQTPTGRQVGYRLVKGGSSIRAGASATDGFNQHDH
jgi:flotillin